MHKVLAVGMMLGGVAGCVASDADRDDDVETEAATTWSFHASEITGGGLANQIAVHPSDPARAYVGGDSWGLYTTTSRGDAWLGAMTAGGTPGTAYTGNSGQYYGSGLAYSVRTPDVVYELVGRVDGTVNGGFLAVRDRTVIRYLPARASAPVVPGGSEPGWNRGDHPRPKGKLVVDHDAATDTEYIYAGGGSGTGIFRSTDGGAHWIVIALASLGTNEFITGMTLDPADSTKLIVTTKGVPNASDVSVGHEYIVSNVRDVVSRVSSRPIALGSLQLESITTVAGVVWAAARTDGIVKSTNGGMTWTRVFAAKGDDMSAIGGRGSLIVAACTASGGVHDCVYRSTTGGTSWDTPFTTTSQDYREWGTNQRWWHVDGSPGAMPSGTGYVANDIAVAADGTTVYLAGRAGVWASRDQGATFRPAVYGLNGTMHDRLGTTGQKVMVDDVDFHCESTPLSDHFDDTTTIGVGGSCTLSTTGTLSATGGGHTIFVTAPTTGGDTSHFYVDCAGNRLASCTTVNDKADAYFHSTVIQPTDVLFAGDYFYIAQSGGGVILAHSP